MSSCPRHTPGGSSSGSAAGVAAGFFPLAFGTQTAGSVIRPAAFCGVVGYKPTFGTIHRAGMKTISESLDTIGVFARSVSDCALFVGAVAGIDLGDPEIRPERPPRLVVTLGPAAALASPATRELLEQGARAAAAKGAQIAPLDLPLEAGLAQQRHFAVVFGDALQALAFEIDAAPHLLSADLRERLDRAAALEPGEVAAAHAALRAARRAFADFFRSFDVILTASAPGEAPEGLAATGDPAFCQLWTAIHAPAVTIPVGSGPAGLPLGLQLVAAPGRDRQLLAWAEWLRAAIG